MKFSVCPTDEEAFWIKRNLTASHLLKSSNNFLDPQLCHIGFPVNSLSLRHFLNVDESSDTSFVEIGPIV